MRRSSAPSSSPPSLSRKYNPDSPSPYGTTLGRLNGIYHFILRLWEESVSFFKEGSLESEAAYQKAAAVLEEYHRAFQYADPDAVHWTQEEQASDFCQGHSAMMAIYQAHFADHLYNFHSIVQKENIGFAPLPSRTSILGGWSLAVRKDSKRKDDALRFRLCREDTAVSYNILGGSIPAAAVFNSFEMRDSYPWLSQTFDGVKHSRPMIDRGCRWITQWEFESAGEAILNRLLDGDATVSETMSALWKMLAEKKSAYI